MPLLSQQNTWTPPINLSILKCPEFLFCTLEKTVAIIGKLSVRNEHLSFDIRNQINIGYHMNFERTIK